jgi:XTP/dITP diphosphohydrolase
MNRQATRPRILVGTTNAHKIAELGALLVGLGCELALPEDVGLAGFDVDETGQTLLANAVLKATAFAARAGMPAIADDSGLEIDSLGGEPGVRSRRYAGEDASDADRIALVLKKLEGLPDSIRTARFRSVIAFAVPDRLVGTGTGTVEGAIDHAPHGVNGFGYDPIFLVDRRRPTMAELLPEAKNAISHRSRAVASVRPVIEAWVETRVGGGGTTSTPPRQ